MSLLVERDLSISIPQGASGRKFDDPCSHGMSNHMKAVDFIVELSDKVIFIELKDPESPQATASRRKEFTRRVLSGTLDIDLKYKFRDSFLYEWACGRVSKPIYYWILITGLRKDQLLTRTDALKRVLPDASHSPRDWKRSFAESCMVFNFDTWNEELSDYQVTRIP